MRIYQLKSQYAEDEHYRAMFFINHLAPANYLRIWDGEIDTDDPEKVYGRFHLNPPEDFHGRPLSPGDVLEIGGQFHFISQEANGMQLWDIGFDATGVKPALFVDFHDCHWEAGSDNAIPQGYAAKAGQLSIPVGINGEPGYHGSHKGIAHFEPVLPDYNGRAYLHPQFLQGEQAREYIAAFKALCDRSNWDEICGELQKQTPLYYEDMMAAKEQYASRPEIKPLYRAGFQDAKRLDEMDAWQKSQKENIRCRDFLDKAMSENYDGFHLGGNIAENAIAQFGHDRVQWVLANTIQSKDHDIRLSKQNKAWAQSVYIPRPAEWERQRDPHIRDDVSDYLLQSDSGLVDIVARKALRLYADLNLYNINHCETGDVHTKNFAGKLLIVRDTALNESYRTPENQLFYATHGNGCTPNAIGRSVFGHFLIDGDQNTFDRSDILGIIDEDQTPEWAALKLHEIQNPSDAPDESPGQSMEGG